MHLDDYQRRAVDSAVYANPHTHAGLTYTVLGLVSEAGEVAGKLKREFRGDSDPQREAMIMELGDTLWYVATAADELGITLLQLAERNLTKLASRKSRGTLHGTGDDR